MKQYQEPLFECIPISREDVIATSDATGMFVDWGDLEVYGE